MRFPPLPPVAVIADAHFHPLRAEFGNRGLVFRGEKTNIRPLSDVVKSTRVFNESEAALRHALNDIARRGIRHVVLLGDYSDDGQVATLLALRALLDEYRRGKGLTFLALPGNHDIFGPAGRHRSKRLLNQAFGADLVTSDPQRSPGPADDRVVHSAAMRCLGYPAGLEALPGTGFFADVDHIHWETPFGTDPAPAARRYMVASEDGSRNASLVDASYLVEPVAGLWLLMIDANVFVPVGGAGDTGDCGFEDSTDAGWNAMLRHKRHVLDWIADVALRARRSGRMLVAFSHYPALDPLDGTRADEEALFGRTGLARRIPEDEVGARLIEAGINIHVSGHLHVNDTARLSTRHGWLVNIAAPSLVGFPAAYKILRFRPGAVAVETVGIGAMPMPGDLREIYRSEMRETGISAPGFTEAETYGAFLHVHGGHLVGRRYLRREWPDALAGMVERLDLGAVARLASGEASGTEAAGDPAAGRHAAMPLRRFVEDWYRLKMGGDLGLEAIAPSDMQDYRAVAAEFAGKTFPEGSAADRLSRLMRMFERFAGGLPSADFTIDLASGGIAPSAPIS